MNKKHIVTLTDQQRQQLETIVKNLTHSPTNMGAVQLVAARGGSWGHPSSYEYERLVRCGNRPLGMASVGRVLRGNFRDQRDKLEGGGTQKSDCG